MANLSFHDLLFLPLCLHSSALQLVRVEAPLLSMVPIPGPQYGEVFGLGVDQLVHRVSEWARCHS